MHAMTGPAPDDELLTEILARRRRRLPKLTLALAALLVVAAAFAVGAEVQKRYGAATASSGNPGAAFAAARAARGLGGFGAGGGGGKLTGGFGGGPGATTGTVTLIKGSTLYVTDSFGNTVLVKTSAASRVTKTVASSVKNIRPGSLVTVQGATAGDGSVTATSIAVGSTNGG